MQSDSRRNLLLLVAIVLFIGVDALILTYPRWLAIWPTTDPSEGKNLPSCLKTSDFYSVHLTTHFAATIADGKTDPKRKAAKYEPYCDQIPGPGQVFFTVDLMEKDARTLSVGLSFFKRTADGQLALVKALPPNLYPSGVLTLDVPIAERGKYVLKLAFGEAKTQDDIIEMPIYAFARGASAASAGTQSHRGLVAPIPSP
jgi:hypothetical protein